MSYFSAHHPHLRLAPDTIEHPMFETWAREHDAREEVARENEKAASRSRRRASGSEAELDPCDPRWILAVRAYSQLQGTMLTPERRERVLRTAKQLGVRTFDASVIIAIVQDQARRGCALDEAQPLLSMVAPPPTSAENRGVWARWLGALLAAAAANAILIWWLTSG